MAIKTAKTDAREGNTTMDTKYRIEWMHNGNWRMDDENHYGMDATRHLDADSARIVERKLRTVDGLTTRIVEDR